uniref:Uncharacterized protein n=1 Tax=Caenorhabditis japonica TaxID=281687 RepID=A0A8R1I6A5_CAEJA
MAGCQRALWRHSLGATLVGVAVCLSPLSVLLPPPIIDRFEGPCCSWFHCCFARPRGSRFTLAGSDDCAVLSLAELRAAGWFRIRASRSMSPVLDDSCYSAADILISSRKSFVRARFPELPCSGPLCVVGPQDDGHTPLVRP